MKDFKPCPFCGSSNIEVVNNNTCDGFAECYCRCRNCWAQSGGVLRIGGQDTWGLAVKQWNNRPLEEEKITRLKYSPSKINSAYFQKNVCYVDSTQRHDA